VLPTLKPDLGLGGTAAGALTALPPLCMAAFAPFSVSVRQRVGARFAVLLGVVLIALGTGARGLGGTTLLFAATVIAGIGIGLVQTVAPATVRERFADHQLAAVGVLSAAISGGAIAAAALSAPIAHATSWRAALAVWAIPAAAAGVHWLFASPAPRHVATTPRHRPDGGPPVARIGLIVGTVSYAYFVTYAWLVDLLGSAGLSASGAGLVLAATSAVGIPVAIGANANVVRAGGVAPALVRWLSLTAAAILGIALVHTAVVVVFALIAGAGLSMLFALSLMLPVSVARDADEAVWLAGRAFGIGYLIAAAGPLVVGFGRDLTGSLAPGFALTGCLLFITASLARSLATRPEEEPWTTS
jgi:MFS transporter, CP family, cyanate transporter